jgi:methionyl-tRNA formyltransferase
MRIVFMGTPDFAVPSLERLIADGYDIVGVFTQPDKPKNRGMKLTPSPVKVCAQAHDLPVFQPTSFKKEPEALETLKSLEPDLVVVAAFGQILPQAVLDVAKLGNINVHSSLLPKYRGAAPINWAILNGEEETGVTIMKVVLALDAGDIISQVKTPIDPDETVETLHDRLAQLGAQLLGETIPHIADGTATYTPQEESQSNYAPMLSRELSPIDWTRSAKEIHNQVRGLIPWPATSATLGDTQFKIFTMEETGETTQKAPGTVVSTDKTGILMACGDGKVLRIVELQAAGKKRMKAADYLRGHAIL